jgi:hypothetical protein
MDSYKLLYHFHHDFWLRFGRVRFVKKYFYIKFSVRKNDKRKVRKNVFKANFIQAVSTYSALAFFKEATPMHFFYALEHHSSTVIFIVSGDSLKNDTLFIGF